MNRAIKERLIELLSEMQAYKESDDGREHTIRCPYCGDSDDPTHSHFGIKIDPDSDEPMPFHCFRCDMSGILTPDVLNDLGVQITDDEYREFKAFNKKAEKLKKKNTLVQKENFVIPLSEPSPRNEMKRAYLAQRLGLVFSYAEMQECRIVPSLYEFMVKNNLRSIEGFNNWQLQRLEEEYVGFISINNNLINFRNINPQSKNKRYVKVILNPMNPGNAHFYSLPSRLDLLDPRPINIHIAEGPLDILSIRFNLQPQQNDPNNPHVFFSSMGFGLSNILRHLIRAGIMGHLNAHIYADRDKKDYEMMKLLRKGYLDNFLEHAYIHRNQVPGEKDYGVPLAQIQDGIRKLW